MSRSDPRAPHVRCARSSASKDPAPSPSQNRNTPTIDHPSAKPRSSPAASIDVMRFSISVKDGRIVNSGSRCVRISRSDGWRRGRRSCRRPHSAARTDASSRYVERSLELTSVDRAPVRGTASPRARVGRRRAATPSRGPGAVRPPRRRHVRAHAPRPRAGALPRERRSRVRRRRSGPSSSRYRYDRSRWYPTNSSSSPAGPRLALEPIREPFVQRCAELLRHRVVHGISDQQMPEPIRVFFAEVAAIRADQVLAEEGSDPLIDRAGQLARSRGI